MVGPLSGRKLPVRLKNRPPRVAAKIHVVDVEFPAGAQNPKSFFDVTVPVPALQMHKDHCAIGHVD